MEPASPPQTEYCPSAQQRTRHVDIRTKFRGAVYCPHCAQRLPTAPHNAAPISIDLTVDSPLTQRTSTTKNTASRGIITTSSTTVPMPDTYQASTMMAVQNRQSSIAATRIRKDPVVVELSAIFWIGDGYIDDSIPGITIPVYKGIRHAGKRTGSVEVVLGRKFSSHSSMIRFIVEQCDERLKEKEWQVVHSVSTVGATSGPVYFPSGAYNTVTLGDLFSQGNITVTKQRDTANLTFWLFNEGPRPDDDCQRPLRAVRGRKRAIDHGPSDMDSDMSTPSPVKSKVPRTAKSGRVSTSKDEFKAPVLSLAPMKLEARSPIKTQVKDEVIAGCITVTDTASNDAALSDPFTSDIEQSETQGGSPEKKLPFRAGRGKNKNRD
ncbi:uncharacterized protein AUP68_10548 [Ilyonectria robusta]